MPSKCLNSQLLDIVSDALPVTAAAVRTYHSMFGGVDAGSEGQTLQGVSKSVRVFMTGDIAFSSEILGKKHISDPCCPTLQLARQWAKKS